MTKALHLTDSEIELLIEALADRYADKEKALAASRSLNQPFTERDFGMPQINALLLRIETLYSED